MGSDKSPMGDRMKAYEQAWRQELPQGVFKVLRVDGRAFHTYTRGLEKPFDQRLVNAMDFTAQALCEEIDGALLAYTQSDEISVLFTEKQENTQQWFGGVEAKQVSIGASVATAAFNAQMGGFRPALFDARVFTVPSALEVANYFRWRQRDTIRNSVSMLGQTFFSHKELLGVPSYELRLKLLNEKGVDWESYPEGFKYGRLTRKVSGLQDVKYTRKDTHEVVTGQCERSWWTTEAAPAFGHGPHGWVQDFLIETGVLEASE